MGTDTEGNVKRKSKAEERVEHYLELEEEAWQKKQTLKFHYKRILRMKLRIDKMFFALKRTSGEAHQKWAALYSRTRAFRQRPLD